MTYTTDKDFELFKRECQKWIDKLSLHDWEIRFYHNDIDDDANETSYFVPKISVIVFSEQIETYPTKSKAIKSLASEEILHVLLSDLATMANNRVFVQDMYSSAEHCVVHRLQKAFDK